MIDLAIQTDRFMDYGTASEHQNAPPRSMVQVGVLFQAIIDQGVEARAIIAENPYSSAIHGFVEELKTGMARGSYLLKSEMRATGKKIF